MTQGKISSAFCQKHYMYSVTVLFIHLFQLVFLSMGIADYVH